MKPTQPNHDNPCQAASEQLTSLDRDLLEWLAAEDAGEESRSERALLELLSHLPEAQAAPVTAKAFAQRLIERIEHDARSKDRWSLRNAATLIAASILLCWIGAFVYAALLGVPPTETASVVGVAGLIGQMTVVVPEAAADVVGGAGQILLEAREATAFAYSPWSLLVGAASLLIAALALLSLERLLPAPQARRAYGSASLGVA